MSKFGEQLKAYRKKHRITQEELARALDIPTVTISRWECGGNVSKAYRKILSNTELK